MKKDDAIRTIRNRLVDRIIKDDRKGKIQIQELQFKKSTLMIQHRAEHFHEKSLLFNIFTKGNIIKCFVRDLGVTNSFIPFETTLEDIKSNDEKFFIELGDKLYENIVNPKKCYCEE